MRHFIGYLEKQINSFLAEAMVGFLIRITGCWKFSTAALYLIYSTFYCILKYMTVTEYGNVLIFLFSAYIPFMVPTLSLYAKYFKEDNPFANDLISKLCELIEAIIDTLWG